MIRFNRVVRINPFLNIACFDIIQTECIIKDNGNVLLTFNAFECQVLCIGNNPMAVMFKHVGTKVVEIEKLKPFLIITPYHLHYIPNFFLPIKLKKNSL